MHKTRKNPKKEKGKKKLKISKYLTAFFFLFFLSFLDWTLCIIAADIYRIPWANVKLGGQQRTHFTEQRHVERFIDCSIPFFWSISLIETVDISVCAALFSRLGKHQTGRATYQESRLILERCKDIPSIYGVEHIVRRLSICPELFPFSYYLLPS